MTRIPTFLFAALVLSTGAFFCSKQKQTGAATTVTPQSNITQTEQVASDSEAAFNPDSVYTRTVGPITIGRDHYINVYVKITHVHKHLDSGDGWPDSDTSFVVVDSLGRELYRRRSVNEAGDAQTDFDCQQLSIPTIGSTIACYSSIAPSYGPHGEDTQILGLGSNNKVVPYTTILPQGSWKVVFLDSRNTVEPTVVSEHDPNALPALEVQYSISSFEVKGYFHIYPEGFQEGKQKANFDFDKIAIIVDTLRAQRGRQPYAKVGRTIRLCDKPTKNDVCPNQVRVRTDSRVKFLDAAYLDGWWIHIIIDGQDGYVPSGDFTVLGLPDLD